MLFIFCWHEFRGRKSSWDKEQRDCLWSWFRFGSVHVVSYEGKEKEEWEGSKIVSDGVGSVKAPGEHIVL